MTERLYCLLGTVLWFAWHVVMVVLAHERVTVFGKQICKR